jgi:hypothetical protein
MPLRRKPSLFIIVLLLAITPSITFVNSDVAVAHGQHTQPDPLAQIVIGPPTSGETLALWQQHGFYFQERPPAGRNINALQAITVAHQNVGDPHAYISAARFGKVLPRTLPASLVGKTIWIVVFSNNTIPLGGKPGIQPVITLGLVGARGKDLGAVSY